MSGNVDVAELRGDLHEVRVADERRCDYCGEPVALDQPVLYEAIRVGSLPRLEQVFDLPAEWIADALRCPDCDRDSIAPATDGFDEALVTVRLTQSDDGVSIDASSISVSAVAPATEGYRPPAINPTAIAEQGDLGLARWLRLEHILAADDVPRPFVAFVRTAVERSTDVPPAVEAYH